MLANPAFPALLGALLVPLLQGRWRGGWMLLMPSAGMVLLWTLPEGSAGTIELFGLLLHPLRIDPLAQVFATAFFIATLLCAIYALHIRDTVQQVAILLYGGSTVGGVLAGDLLTLFVFWELTGITSVFLILARRTDRGVRAGLRYLAAQVTSGVLLLGGIVLYVQAGNDLTFGNIGTGSVAGWLILLAIGIKCAFPVLHVWLQDTYPEATIVGTVALSPFTTKLAIYALLRGFEGTELLIWVGAIMTCFPILYAVIENDLRRVLAYSLINQLGFMVVGAGIGGELGVNGAASHAFAHIIYKALLFMAMGAVLYRVGTIKASELGGLYKSMPQTAALCIVGAASISAFPLFSGFVTKSITMDAAAEQHLPVIWLMLLFASAGVFHHAGIKVPFFAFFAQDRGHRVQEAPLNMRAAMGLAAAACVFIGLVPGPLYALLPYPVDFVPYTAPHVINQLQLLLLAAMAFTVLMRTGLYPPELRAVNVDFDVVYRRVLPRLGRAAARDLEPARNSLGGLARRAGNLAAATSRPVGPGGWLSASWSTGAMVWWVAMLLVAYLVVSLL